MQPLRWTAAGLLLLSLWCVGVEHRADEPPVEEPAPTGAPEDVLPERHREWLADVKPLISEVEREVFLGLDADFRRDAFVRKFWQTRDPFPDTARNELKERWDGRVEMARERFGGLDNERARMVLLFGEPSRSFRVPCQILRGTPEVWLYHDGAPPVVPGAFSLVFAGVGVGAERLWRPISGLGGLMSAGRGIGASDQQLARVIANECTRGGELLSALAQYLDVEQMRERGPLFPTPGPEWVRTFEAR
ncbi:MAG: GWxTD domain-containing protein, partial [Acidobacteriota bacterium]